MNVLVVGGGGREHAMAWKLKQSPRADRVFVAPGNGGTAVDAENVDIAADDIPALLKFCLLYTSPSPRDATLSRMPSSA